MRDLRKNGGILKNSIFDTIGSIQLGIFKVSFLSSSQMSRIGFEECQSTTKNNHQLARSTTLLKQDDTSINNEEIGVWQIQVIQKVWKLEEEEEEEEEKKTILNLDRFSKLRSFEQIDIMVVYSSFLKEVGLWSLGTFAGLYSVYRVSKLTLNRLFLHSESNSSNNSTTPALGWYDRLAPKRREEMAKAVATITHHALVTAGSLYCLFSNDSSRLRDVLLLEIGFDVSDTVCALLSGNGIKILGVEGSFTSLPPVAVTMHHSVALVLDLLGLLFEEKDYIVPWRTAASLAAILLGSGALDLGMIRFVRNTPLWNSPKLFWVTLGQFLLFLVARVGFFGVEGVKAIAQAKQRGNGWIFGGVTFSFVLLSLFHLVLGTGLWKALKNGGRIEAPPESTPSKQ